MASQSVGGATIVVPSSCFMRFAGWRRDLDGDALDADWVSRVVVSVLLEVLARLRLRVDDEVETVSCFFNPSFSLLLSPFSMPLTSSSRLMTVAVVEMSLLLATRLSRVCVDRVFRGDVESAAINRAVSRDTFEVLIVIWRECVELRKFEDYHSGVEVSMHCEVK